MGMGSKKENHMPAFRTLDDVDLHGKKVVIRLDLNVPIKDGVVTDTTRIDRVVSTLKELLNKGAAVIILAHFDRPKGKVVPEMSLKPVAPALEKALGHKVKFVFTDWQTAPTLNAKPGDVILMENTRYHAGEEKNDVGFAKMLGALGDVFVNDAFSAAHRAHSSTEGIAHVIPAYAGRAMQAELAALGAALETPKKPVIAVVGGAKVSSKLDLLGNLVKKVEALVIGGAMANTFLYAQGLGVGKSLHEPDLAETARAILATAEKANCAIILPVDGIIAKEFKAGAESHAYGIDAMPADGMMLDVGPMSVERVKSAIDGCHTLLWNGPFGAFEIEPFDAATNAVAQYAAARTKAGKLITVAGGGDTVSALNHAGVAQDFTYISTAGGAFLEWLEGKELPGVKALEV
jgi:phosphoglycerate kinase